MGADLTGGRILMDDIEDLVIECPLHKIRFDLRTGKSISSGFSVSGLETYPTRISPNGEIEIGFTSLNPLMFSPELISF